jgi:lipopolysaccharide transport system ATP-binding protein
MYVRLAFAVAAHLEPEILIVDEVLAVGDIQFQKKCIGKMEDVSSNEGRTVLFVSHNMEVLSRLCKRALLLEKGEMLAIGETDSIVSKYLLSRKNTREYSKKNTNEIIVTDLIIRNSSGQVSSSVVSMEDCTIEMYCESQKAIINEVSFAVCLNNIQEQRITSIWSAYKGQTFNVNPGKFVVVFNIHKLRLMPGDYEIITYIETRGTEIQRIDNYDRLFVRYTNSFGSTVEPNTTEGTYFEDFNVNMSKIMDHEPIKESKRQPNF